ncbi:UNVERIFIED_CONTAM: hypothetical protein GTU68_038339 [Idotea baltica]|nr:hypothetical protein [Idotea baltica]
MYSVSGIIFKSRPVLINSKNIFYRCLLLVLFLLPLLYERHFYFLIIFLLLVHSCKFSIYLFYHAGVAFADGRCYCPH